MKLQIDSLVEGLAGTTDHKVKGRVFRIQPWGVAILDQDGKQWIIYEPTVLDRPRPVAQRTDVPSRLQ